MLTFATTQRIFLARAAVDMRKSFDSLASLAQVTPLGEIWSYNNAGFYIAGRVIEVSSLWPTGRDPCAGVPKMSKRRASADWKPGARTTTLRVNSTTTCAIGVEDLGTKRPKVR